MAQAGDLAWCWRPGAKRGRAIRRQAGGRAQGENQAQSGGKAQGGGRPSAA